MKRLQIRFFGPSLSSFLQVHINGYGPANDLEWANHILIG
jgi:hypothetical protein